MEAKAPAPDATGEFLRSPVAQLLWDLAARRFSGTLVVRADDDGGVLAGESTLAFEGGRLAQARLPQPLDTVGFVLHEQGVIDSAQLNASLMRLASREGLQGEILVSMRACTADVVQEALREQLRRKLLRLFALVYGRFELHTGVDLLEGFGRERYPIEVVPLLWAGVRMHPRHPAIDSVVGRLASEPLRLRAGSPALALYGEGPGERVVIGRLATSARFEDLLVCGAPSMLVKSLVYLLAMTRQIERAGPSAPGAPRPSQAGIPAVGAPPTAPAPRPSSPGVPAVGAPPSQPVVPPDLTRRTSGGLPLGERGAAPPQRVSTSNLPTVKGASMTEVLRGAQAVPPMTPGTILMRISEAETTLARMDQQTAFAMLDVQETTPPARVTAAFRALAVRWHPEAAPASSPALREYHERIFALLSEADATLTNERSREEYLREVLAGGGTPWAKRARAAQAAEVVRAEQALRQQSWAEAERIARKVLVTDAREPTALVILATAVMEQTTTGSYDDVRKYLLASFERQPENDRAHMVAAQLYKRLGDERRMLGHCIKAYKINPRNVDAARELRLAAMRKREAGAIDQESSTFLSKLFGMKG